MKAIVVSFSQIILNDNWRKVSWENGSIELIFMEGCFRENSSGELDMVWQPLAENQKQKQGPDLIMYSLW